MSSAKIERAEQFIGLAISALVVSMLVVRAIHAGALWRDECAALNLAAMPTWGELLENFRYESFPIAFFAIVRPFISIFGAGDHVLRCFGLLVGLAAVGAAWMMPRSRTYNAPLLILTLVGLNSTFLVWGTTVRGYGIGAVLAIAVVAAAARFVESPGWQPLSLFFVVTLLSVHVLYFNVAIAAATLLTALVVCLLRRRRSAVLQLVVVGVLVAVSYLPYLMIFATTDWKVVMHSTVDPRWLWETFLAAFGEPNSVMPALWAELCIFSALAAGRRIMRLRHVSVPDAEWDLLFFGTVLLVLVIPIFGGSLWLLKYAPQPWYYLSLVAAVAASLELIWQAFSKRAAVRLVRLALVTLAAGTLPFALWPKLLERQTSIDIIARMLQEKASPGDLIVVNPWFFGLSFNRYYTGTVPWLMVPNVSERRLQRNDLFKAKMMSPDPIGDVIFEMRRTMQAGNTVWLLGGADLPPSSGPLELPPAPQSQYGWSNDAYRLAWSQQLGAFTQKHSLNASVMSAPEGRYNDAENPPVYVMSGWRD
jgi:hypothetical protein